MLHAFFSVLATAVILTTATGNLTSGTAPEPVGAEGHQALQQTKPAAIPAGTYVGTIPCADCEGIKMELTLKDKQGGQSRAFTMKQTYLGKTSSTSTSTEISGIWFVATGNKQNPKAVVLQLIPSNGRYDPSYFVLVNKNQLKMLDREQNEIKSKQNYTLKKS